MNNCLVINKYFGGMNKGHPNAEDLENAVDFIQKRIPEENGIQPRLEA